ncbi:unnamed protein product [Moneuplotes crassus]|uniref:Uncharacterized protein n=1 Tax=Euplotes crassus TaxID=5936 RepID=A0AAD2D489_EUPCR|nr:unnamed protein product [Moneuplotes crassus]
MNLDKNATEKTERSIQLGKFPNDISNTSKREHGNLKKVLFRNYIPSDKEMREMTEEIDHFVRVSKIEKMYEKKATKVIKKSEKYLNDPINFRPKKQTVDLKRMLDKKLAHLNKKTENALVKLMKQNIIERNKKNKNDLVHENEEGGDGREILEAVLVQERLNEMDNDEDEDAEEEFED